MNRRTLILCISLLCSPFFCLAQDSEVDSLRKLLQTTKEDTFRVKTLLQLSTTYLQYEGDSSKMADNFSLQAKDLSQKLGYKRGIAYALKNLGMVPYYKGLYMETLEYWNESLAIFESIGDELGVANTLSNIGSIYRDKGDDDKALENFLKSLALSEKLGNKFRIATALQNIGAVYAAKDATLKKAIDYFRQALPICIDLKDESLYSIVSGNIGETYLRINNVDSALYYFNQSLKAGQGTQKEGNALFLIGKVYSKKHDFPKAINYYDQALFMARKYDNKLDSISSLMGLGEVYYQLGDTKSALKCYHQAQTLITNSGLVLESKDALLGLAESYAKTGDFANAYKYQTLVSNIKDTIYDINRDKKLEGKQFTFDMQKKQTELDLITKDKKLVDSELNQQKITKNAFILGFVMIAIITFIIYRDYRNKVKTNKILDSQKAEIEGLLLNILPQEVANELQKDGTATPRYYESVSVMFTDFKSFTIIADALSPQEVVSELNACFMAFDDIIEKYNLEKIKTIGDSYMCAAGFGSTDRSHPVRIIKASQEIQKFVEERNQKRNEKGLESWEIRIGIHTGPVVAGVVGKKKYAYDIWGSTVNIASRMESNGAPGQVNISADTYELVKDKFYCNYRGKIYAKNVGEVDMYFVSEEQIENITTEIRVPDNSHQQA